jgi:mannosyl-3-phosphoglycerate phosphatase
VTTKTRAEVIELQEALSCHDPAIVEGGGALFFSARGRVPAPPRAREVEGGRQIDLATPRAEMFPRLLEALRLFPRARPFSWLSEDELCGATGLEPADAALAREREFDEPVLLSGGDEDLLALREALAGAGLGGQGGGRFLHALEGADKGSAARELLRSLPADDRRETAGVGDAAIDVAFLREVARPVVLPRRDGTFPRELLDALPHARRAPAGGSAGWSQAVLALLTSV